MTQKQKNNKKDIFSHLLRLLTIVLLFAAVAINRDGKILGNDIDTIGQTEETTDIVATELQSDGSIVINTTQLGKDVMGYAGPTPLLITVKDGVVIDIKAEKNNETPDFFDEAYGYLSQKWQGKKVEDILAEEPDGATGATMSSNALNANMRMGLAQLSVENAASTTSAVASPWSIARIAALIVVALGCILPLFQRFKKYRTLWLCVNVAVLGFWSGTFLNYTIFVNYMANGTHIVSSLAVILMLAAAFIYPFFGKKSYYCTWICPLGSLQELAGKANKNHKWKMSAKTTKLLTRFNEVLWAALMLLMLTGVFTEWIDYELFTAFLFTTASPFVVAFAVVFVVLAVFVPRPYCRFVCPTGCLFKITQ